MWGRRLCLYPVRGCDAVRVLSSSSGRNSSSFAFLTLPGHVEGANARVTFTIYQSGKNLRLSVSAQGPDGRFGRVINPFRHLYARFLWAGMAVALGYHNGYGGFA